MNLDALLPFFEMSPSVRLMRMTHAPFLLHFLDEAFKSGDRIVIAQSELRTEFSTYQDNLHQQHPDIFKGSPDRYFTDWCDNGLLHRFLNADSIEPQYQLTRHTEEVLRFADGSIVRGGTFIGTESRLKLVIGTLTDLVQGSSTDPNRRLTLLRNQRAEIDREIEKLESGAAVEAYQPVEIRERFQTAIEMLKTLQSDFRAVEENFRRIAVQVQQRQQDVGQSRGGILGYALDAEDMLKQQDQGVSFFAFVNFLFSTTQREQLRETVSELQGLAEVCDQEEALRLVKGMMPALLAEADKVMRTIGRLSATLRRLLDSRATTERRRVASVIRDVRSLAMRLRETATDRDIGLTVESELEFHSPFAKAFWTRPNEFDSRDPEVHVMDPRKNADAFLALAKMQRLDWSSMRERISRALADGHLKTLGELMTEEPPQNGVVELLGYVQIAHDDGHVIDDEQSEAIRVETVRGHSTMEVTVPLVRFSPLPRKAK